MNKLTLKKHEVEWSLFFEVALFQQGWEVKRERMNLGIAY